MYERGTSPFSWHHADCGVGRGRTEPLSGVRQASKQEGEIGIRFRPLHGPGSLGWAIGPGGLDRPSCPGEREREGVEVAPCEEAESSLRVDCGLQADLQEELVLEKYRHATGISYMRERERERQRARGVRSGDGLSKHKQGNWEAPPPEGVTPRHGRAPWRGRPTGQRGHTLIPQASKQASSKYRCMPSRSPDQGEEFLVV